ncbi:MAG: hypothetical protein MZV64_68170 [Ignavibacteriales bacterium]|nr:hypothetical protein [Ignavibacteriales bacterium]
MLKRTKSGVKDSLGNEVAALDTTKKSTDTTSAADTTKQLSEEEFRAAASILYCSGIKSTKPKC